MAKRTGGGDSGRGLARQERSRRRVIRGAVDDDPQQCVAVPVARLRELLDSLSL